MSKREKFRKVKNKMAGALPSRSRILDFLARADNPVAIKQIVRGFELEPNQSRALSEKLGKMRKSGLIVQGRNNRYSLANDKELVRGKVIGHSDGYGFVTSDDVSEDLYLSRRQMQYVLHQDEVLARVRKTDYKGRKEGTILVVITDTERKIVGRFLTQKGIGYVQPNDTKFAQKIAVPRNRVGQASDGDLVVVKLLDHPFETGRLTGAVVEILGKPMEPGMEHEIAIRSHDIPYEWPHEVREELKLQSLTADSPGPGRKDLRQIPLVTIDGEDAKDFDDAVFCSESPNGWQLIVAIADVSHYVKAGSALDIEAFNRGNSVYLPRKVIPMLPEELSNGICSLNPGEDRNCMVCDMEISREGEVFGVEFYQGVMHSHARLTYNEVNSIVIEKNPPVKNYHNNVLASLDSLYQLSQRLRMAREEQGSMDFSFPEPLVLFDEHQKVSSISIRERNEAHRLIEECMLVANVCAANLLLKNPSNGIYRNHFGPDVESLKELKKFLSVVGLTLDGGDTPLARDYQNLMAKVATNEALSFVVQTVLLRSLSRAIYSSKPEGHFALGFPVYTHFTSPIRRFSDLIVHREIKSALGLLDSNEILAVGVNYEALGEQCSYTEQRADNATWEVIAWLKAEFMSNKVGEEFDGVVTGVKDFGVFVQLKGIFVDGLVHVTALGHEYFHYDADQFQLVGENSGKRFALGDSVKVRVIRVDLEERKIDFELASMPKIARESGRTRRNRAYGPKQKPRR